MVTAFNLDFAEVDAFLARQKRLQRLSGDGKPVWTQGSRDYEVTAIWNIEDDLGAVVALLRFNLRKSQPAEPSMSLIFRQRPIWRIDVEPSSVRRLNPPWAATLGLPPYVEGTHEHSWQDNRDFLATALDWELQAHRPIEDPIRRLSQAIPWFAERINLGFDDDQRGFDVPPQSELEFYDVGR